MIHQWMFAFELVHIGFICSNEFDHSNLWQGARCCFTYLLYLLLSFSFTRSVTGLLEKGFMSVWSTFSHPGAPRSSAWGLKKMISWKPKPRLMVRLSAQSVNQRVPNPGSWLKEPLWKPSLQFLTMSLTISREVIKHFYLV